MVISSSVMSLHASSLLHCDVAPSMKCGLCYLIFCIRNAVLEKKITLTKSLERKSFCIKTHCTTTENGNFFNLFCFYQVCFVISLWQKYCNTLTLLQKENSILQKTFSLKPLSVADWNIIIFRNLIKYMCTFSLRIPWWFWRDNVL